MAIQLSKQQQQYLAAGVFLSAVVIFLYVWFFWLPISKKQSELSDQIEQTDRKIAQAKAEASRLKQLQGELAVLKQQASDAEKRLPREKSVPDILDTLSSLARKYNVTILKFAPGPQKSQQYFVELDYPMSISGRYNDIGRFLAAIALEERIFNVRDVVYPGAAADGKISASFTLLTYQYKG
ncbi:MAG: type 4a pilus biogenesis protein PilO [Elusimicrobia bacterium]|nr:type 4a pilus biogenesis protein PilO [Elusimicrobiota bacterium]